MTYLRIAGFAVGCAMIACGGECSDDAECRSHLLVEFEDYDEWTPGSYAISVGGYGACSIEVRQPPTTPGCGGGSEAISISGSGSFFIPNNPDSVHVTVEKDGEPFKDIVVSPDYERPRPVCWPSCFQAHETIE